MPRQSTNAIWNNGLLVGWHCTGCDINKELNDYHVCLRNKTSGKQRRCKVCMRAANRAYMIRNRDSLERVKTIRVRLSSGQYGKLVALGQEFEDSPSGVAQSILANHLEGFERLAPTAPAQGQPIKDSGVAEAMLAAAQRALDTSR